MEPARSIGRLGFRKWYERRLTEGYAWLVTALLCGVVLLVSVELVSFSRPLPEWLGNAGLAFVAGLIAWHGTRRFLEILSEAERMGSQSTCKACRKYAAFTVIAESPRMSVRCRNCSHEWTFE